MAKASHPDTASPRLGFAVTQRRPSVSQNRNTDRIITEGNEGNEVPATPSLPLLPSVKSPPVRCGSVIHSLLLDSVVFFSSVQNGRFGLGRVSTAPLSAPSRRSR